MRMKDTKIQCAIRTLGKENKMNEVLDRAKRMGWDTSKVMSIPKEEIDFIFTYNDTNDNPHQQNVLVDLYKVVIPDWDNITKVKNGWPIVNRKTNEYIFRKWMDFDDKHHDCLRGGLWMNNGFSTNMELVPLEVSPLPDFHAYVGHLEFEYGEGRNS